MPNPTFVSLLEQMVDVHNKKSNDYATADNPYKNFEFAGALADKFSDPTDRAFMTLLGVKFERLAQLLGAGKTPSNESVDDTMLDASNYMAIWTAYRRDRRQREQS